MTLRIEEKVGLRCVLAAVVVSLAACSGVTSEAPEDPEGDADAAADGAPSGSRPDASAADASAADGKVDAPVDAAVVPVDATADGRADAPGPASDATADVAADSPGVADASPDGRADAADASAAADAIADAVADAPVSVDASDAGPDAIADAASDARADASADGGPLQGPTLLLADTASNKVYLLSVTGTILGTYTSPVAQVTGVAHDRRLRDGFWAAGSASASAFYKVGWSGTLARTLANGGFQGSAVRGLDYYLGATENDDFLAFVHTNPNNLDVVSSTRVTDGTGMFSSGFFNGGFQSGYWGVSVVEYVGMAVRSLFTNRTNDRIERWLSSSFETFFAPSPVIAEPRGLARTPQGELYVADATTAKVYHLRADGVVLDSFTPPGTTPAGLSYDPGQ